MQLRQGLRAFTKNTVQEQRKDLVQTARIAAILAETTGKDVIWHTPSSISHQPKDDRVWTGRMVDSFQSDVGQSGRNITIRFGWITKKSRYFLIQEYGGFAFGKTVTPMFAIAQSKTVAQDFLKSKGIH